MKILLAVLAALVVLLGVHMVLAFVLMVALAAVFAVCARAMENGWRIIPARRLA